MALYSPIPPSTPRIVITEPGGVLVPWNRNYLAAIWISQFFFLLLGMAVVPVTIEEYISIVTILIVITSLGNLALVITPCIEAHKYAVGTLTPEFFHQMQLWKAKWTIGVVVSLVLSQLNTARYPYFYTGVWKVVWVVVADVLYTVPFAGGLWYAREVKRQAAAADDGEDVEGSRVRLG